MKKNASISFRNAFSIPGRSTFMATSFPLDFNIALCTCAKEAAAIGSETEVKISESLMPNSFSIISDAVSLLNGGRES